MKILFLSIITLCTFFIHTLQSLAKDILVVSIAPQAYLLKRIVGTTQDVITFLPRGADPHTFEPSVQILQQVSHAKVFFTIGIGLESQWEHRLHAIAPSVIFVPSYVEQATLYTLHAHDRNLQTAHAHHNHEHDTPTTHSHQNCIPLFKEREDGSFVPVNQHVWTSPRAMQVVVEQMLTQLVRLYPQYTQMYTNNASSLLQQINSLDKTIQKALEHKKNRVFLSYHPSWQYFAHEYNLQELVIEENEREPSAKTMIQLIKIAKEKHVRVILTQPQFSQKSVQTLSKELNNIPIVKIDPLQEDWFTMMKQMKDTLEKYLQ